MKKYRPGWMVLLFVVALLPVTAGAAAATNFNDSSFAATWEKVDKPVQDLAGTGRGYTWGPPAPGSEKVTTEAYGGGTRKVQYFDKARMEINNPAGNPNDLFYVTTGLLVKELVTGDRQDGDNTFVYQGPSQVQVAGDSNENGQNAIAPAYASFKNVGTFSGIDNGKPEQAGFAILDRINKAGEVTTFTPPEQRLLKGYDTVTKHNVADVFTDYGNIQGKIWNGQTYVDGAVFFGNPTYVLGRPITEPYWVRAVVAGTERDVLVQLFERRVLTYTPSNPAGFKVEMGNVGQHYYRWRYSQNPAKEVASGLAFNMTAAGNYVFWMDRQDTESFLYGYDVTKSSKFLIAKTTGDLVFPASDGKTVAWSQTPNRGTVSGSKILGYDLATGKTFEIVKATPNSFYENLSVDQGKLYYQDNTEGHLGFYSHDIATGKEQFFSNAYQGPIVRDGILMWYNEKSLGTPPSPSETTLHIQKVDGSLKDTEIFKGVGGLSGYSISGDRVVWNFYPPDTHKDFGLYTISTGKTQIITTGQPTRNPVIAGDKVVLTLSPSEGNPDWGIGVYDLNSGTLTTVVKNTLPINVWGIAGTNGFAYSVNEQGVTRLYYKSFS